VGTHEDCIVCAGNRPDRVDKAVTAKADAVIIDLEDAVPMAHKAETRAKVREKVVQYLDKQIIVRVNGLGTGFVEADLDEVAVEGASVHDVPLKWKNHGMSRR